MRKEGRLKALFNWFKTGKRKWWAIGGILIILLLGGRAIWQHKNNAALQEEMLPPPAPTAFVERGEVQRLIYAAGNIQEDTGEEIWPGINAKITSVLVKEGQAVKPGDVLFTLDNDEISLEYAKEQLNYKNRCKDLKEEITALQKAEIKACKAGTIDEILVERGQKIEADTIIARLVRYDAFDLKVGFNGKDIKYIKRGQEAQVFLQNYFSYIPGTVTEIESRGQGTADGGVVYRVTVEVENPGALKEEDLARIEINTGDKNLHSIGLEKLKLQDKIDLRAECQGEIKELSMNKGDEIHIGEILGLMDKEEQKDALEEKQIDLEQANLDMELKQKEFDKYQGVATVEGIVTEINVVEGKNLSDDEDDPAIVIANTMNLKMKVKVDETDIPLIKLGQKAKVYTSAYGDREFQAEVTRVAEKGKIENSSVYFETELTIKDPGPLKPGMTGDADIMAAHKENVLRLPRSAVNIDNAGEGTVMCKGEGEEEGEEDIPEPRKIKIDLEGDDFVEIIEGLQEGDEILLN